MMSEPITKRQPLIDLDEFERRMRQTNAAPESGGDAVEELIRIVSGATQTASESDAAEATADGSDPIGKQSIPLFDGDFAEIEAALLRAAGEAAPPLEIIVAEEHEPLELRAASEEAQEPADYASGDFSAKAREMPDDLEAPTPPLSARRDEPLSHDAPLDSLLAAPLAHDQFVFVDDAAVSGSEAVAEEAKRSRRPLYIMAAVVLAGIAGIVASSSHKHDGAVEISQESAKTAALAPDASEPAAAKTDPGATANAAPPEQSSSADPATTAPQSPAAAPQVPAGPQHGVAPRVISLDGPAPDNAPANLAATTPAASVLAPAPLGAPVEADAQTPVTPPAPAAIADPKTVKTAAVRPDGSLIKADAPAAEAPVATPPHEARASETPTAPSPGKSAEAKSASGKLAAEKTEAGKSSAHRAAAAKAAVKTVALPPRRPAASAKIAESKPPRDGAAKAAANAEPAGAQDGQAPLAAADAQPVAPAPAPAPKPAAANGPLAFVDTAVNSITGATSKLLDWGHTATAAHN